MARTFEALLKSKEDNHIRPEEAKAFDLTPHHKVHIPLNFKIPPQIAEEYYRMKQLIRHANPERKITTLLLSSSKAGEGTSTVLRTFAITLASSGDRVLVVDANLRNPTLHSLFNVEKKNGLTELLINRNTLPDAIKKTQIKHLSIITSGIPHSNPSSVLDSSSLASVIEQMKEHYDWILFDSPPINACNDSSTLASKMDGAVMVVQAENTRWEVAQRARERIESDKVKILGVVLNRRKMYIPDWAYKLL